VRGAAAFDPSIAEGEAPQVTGQAHSVKLSGELGLRDADSLRGQLLDALLVHTSVEVDALDLTAVDMSIVQVLLAAQRMAKSRNQRLHICAQENSTFQDALSRAGLLAQTAEAPLDVYWQARG
jgi:anti-anti-sigma regulatory factor